MTEARFELLAFRALPGPATVAVLEVEGRFTGAAPRGCGTARLRVESGGRVLECEPAVAPVAAGRERGLPWRAAFAVDLALIEDAAYAIAIGPDLLVELPAPDPATDGPEDDTARLARLAREVNELRRRLDAAAASAAAAEDRARCAVQARRRTEQDLAETAQAREEAERRLAEAREEAERRLAETREEAERRLAEAREEAERRAAEASTATDPTTPMRAAARPTAPLEPHTARAPLPHASSRSEPDAQRIVALAALAIAIAAFVLVVVIGVGPL